MNKAFIIGRLTRDPERRTTGGGVSVTTFTVAVTRRMNRDEADYLNIVTWRGLADICGKHLSKGRKVAVLGEIQTRSYDGKDGKKRYMTEIIADEVEFIDSAPPKSEEDRAAARQAEDLNKQGTMHVAVDEDEELPF